MRLGPPDATGRQAPEEIHGARLRAAGPAGHQGPGLRPRGPARRLFGAPDLKVTRWGTGQGRPADSKMTNLRRRVRRRRHRARRLAGGLGDPRRPGRRRRDPPLHPGQAPTRHGRDSRRLAEDGAMTDAFDRALPARTRAADRGARLRPGVGARRLRRGPGLRHRRQAAPRGGRAGHPRAEGGLAPRRGRRRRQDRRRRRHAGQRAAGLLRRPGARASATRCAAGAIAVGQIFLPRIDLAAQEAARTIVESEVLRFGFYIYGWRQVPIDIRGDRREGRRHPSRDRADHAGAPPGPGAARRWSARCSCAASGSRSASRPANLPGFYICSLSARSLIYKGMFLAEHIDDFYPDLRDAALRSRRWRSSTSAIRPTPSRNGGWPSRSGCWPTTARSTR